MTNLLVLDININNKSEYPRCFLWRHPYPHPTMTNINSEGRSRWYSQPRAGRSTRHNQSILAMCLCLFWRYLLRVRFSSSKQRKQLTTRFDSGYMNGVLGMRYFITLHTGLDPATTPSEQFTLPAWQKSLITSVLSAGTFFGALIAGDLADWIGRRWTIISGCAIFCVGNVLQTASSDGLGLVSVYG